MSNDILILALTAGSIGFLHTLIGPDHYLPFIMIGRAQQWSQKKTMLITFLCGLGHVLSSVILGLIGVAFGIAISKIEAFEGTRGGLAAWALIAFGLTYCVWGIHRAWKNKPHTHLHIHEDGSYHDHKHTHQDDHAHVHAEGHKKPVTPWILFTVFVLGPCEPLIPILMYPAAKSSVIGMLFVTGVFTVATIGTMMGVVAVASWGIRLAPMHFFERYMHAVAGATICLSGLAIQVLGL